MAVPACVVVPPSGPQFPLLHCGVIVCDSMRSASACGPVVWSGLESYSFGPEASLLPLCGMFVGSGSCTPECLIGHQAHEAPFLCSSVSGHRQPGCALSCPHPCFAVPGSGEEPAVSRAVGTVGKKSSGWDGRLAAGVAPQVALCSRLWRTCLPATWEVAAGSLAPGRRDSPRIFKTALVRKD